jgi:predicted MFS family arabinose efflux permease
MGGSINQLINSLGNTYRQAYSGLPREVWVFSLITLLNRCGTMALVFFVLYLTNVYDFSNHEAGLVISLSGVGGILGALVGGWASDRFGAIPSQIVFLVLVALQFGFLVFAKTRIEIGMCLFVLVFFNEAVRPGLHAACLDYCNEDNQKRAMGLLRLMINLGMSIGPVVGGFLAEYELWDWLFLVDGVTCLVTAGLLFLMFGLKPATLASKRSPGKDAQVQGGSPWKDLKLLKFGLFYLMTLVVFVQVNSTYVKYLEEVYWFSESRIGLITAVNPLVIVLLEMVIIQVVQRHSTLKTIAVGSFLICLGFGLLPFGTSSVFCVMTVLVWTAGEILAFPMASVYVVELSQGNNRGRYMGFITVLFSISMIIGPVAGLALYEINQHLPWYLALGIGGFSGIGLWRMATSTVR